MNAKCYRTVFNAVRGMLVAVEESARSTGKGRQTGGQAGTSAASTSTAARFAVLPVVFGAWCALGLPYTVQAQVVAAPGSGAHVIQTQNGLQQVNIARPNGSGVSLNTYTQFNVPSQGTLLNNAPGITQTQQAGYVNGNPNLLPGGSARIIVNQVTSTSPSTLRGYLEVAGPRAEVVIANPNGILVNGGGFINTSRATLTTGVPVFGGSGSLDAYRVTGGQITVQGAGLNASNVDQVDLIARAVSVNASVYANQLNVVAGANQVDRSTLGATPIAGDGAAPANGIDVSQLGGMYANKILLASTEKGVGVSLRGVAAAQAGDLTLTSQGKLVLAGQTNASGNLSVSAQGGIDNTGTTYGRQSVTVGTSGDLTNSGTLAAQQNLSLNANHVTSSGTLGAGVNSDGSLAHAGDLSVVAGGAMSATGQNVAGGNATLQGASVHLAGSQTSANGNLSLNAQAGNLDLTGATASAGGALSANAQGALINDRGHLASQGATAITAGSLSNQNGQIVSQSTLSANIAGVLANQGGILQAAGALNANAGSLDNTAGHIASLNTDGLNLTTTGRLTNAQGGTIGGNGNVTVQAGQLNNTGTISAVQNLGVSTAQTLTNAGTLAANGNTTVSAGTTLTNAGGTIAAGQRTNVSAATLDNSAGTLTGNQLALAAANLINRNGSITQSGTGPITIGVSGTLDNTNGSIQTNSADLTLAPATLINDHGTITDSGTGTLSVTTGRLSNTGGTIATNGALDVQAGAVSNQGGKLSAQSQATLNVASLDNSAGGYVGAQGVAITDQGALNNAGGTVAASGALTVSAGAIANAGGAIKNAGTQATRVSATQALSNTQGGLIGGNGEVSVSGGSVDNSGGTVVAGGTAAVQSGSTLRNAAGRVQAKGSAAVTAAGAITNTGGQIEADGASATLQVTGASLDNTNGRIANAGSGATTVGAASIINANTGGVAGAGTIGGNGDVTVSGQTLSNTQGGQIVAGHDLTLATARSVNNSGGTLSAANNVTANAAGAAVVNQAGSIRGNGAVSLNAASLDNTSGKIGNDAGSGGSVAMTTGSLANQGGAIGSDRNLSVTTGQLSGDGRIIAGGDGAITINGNYTHSAANQIQANHNLTFTTTGTLTNQGTLAAVNALTVNAASVDNRAGADLNSASTAVNAGGAITNAGRIEGDTVSTQSGSFANTGTVIGNNVTLNARAISNTGASAALAAATQLNLYASDSLSNTGGATIFSLGDINIAANGARDGTGLLANRSNLVNNDQSTIEAQGNLEIATQTLNNTRPAPTVQTVTTGTSTAHETKRGKYIACATMNAAPHGGCTQAVWNSGYKTPIDATFSTSQIVSQTSGPNPVDNVLVVNVNGQNQTLYYNAVTNNGNGTVSVNYWDAYDPHTNYVPSTEYATRSDGHNGYQRVEISRDTTTTTQQDQVTSSAPQARLLAGRNMTLANVGTINNNYSAIAAGGSIRIGSSQQGGAVGSGNYGGTTVNNVGRTLYQYQTQNIVSTYAWNEGTNEDVGAVAQAPSVLPPVAIGGTGGTLIANNAVQINATNLNNTNVAAASSATGATGGTLGANQSAAGVATSGQQTVGAASAQQPAVNAPQSVAGSNGALNISLPTSGLFSFRTAPGQPYLIATDPRLTSYTKFISSDYMLSALNLNPQQVQKRLGDGFYEEKLVRDQITQLTGRVYLQGYGNNEDQYRALMASGVNAAKQFSLVPGIALTAAQMDALTSDIVWLVTQTVKLPDGSTQQVLAPVVYLAHTHANDLQPTGALIAADDVQIHAVGSATNSGVIKGGTQTVITATDIVNRGGTIASDKAHGTTVVSATHDILNASGEISGNRVAAQAGHDIVNTTLVDTVGATAVAGNSRANVTLVGRQGSIASTGDLLVRAGNDLTVHGANITAGGNAQVTAGHDILVDAVQSTTSQSVTKNSQHHWEADSTTHQGSTISAGSNLAMQSGNDTTFKGAKVSAGQDLVVVAGGDLTATTVTDTSKYNNVAADDKARKESSRTYDETVAGTTFTAGRDATFAAVNANAGGQARTDGKGNVTFIGSSVTAGTAQQDNTSTASAAGNPEHMTVGRIDPTGTRSGASTKAGGVTIVADRNVTLAEAREVHDSTRSVSSESGSALSSKSASSSDAMHLDVGAGSSVSGNSVRVQAGNDLTVRNSAVVGSGDVSLNAVGGNVLITAGQNVRDESHSFEQKQSGFSGTGGIGIAYGHSGANGHSELHEVTQSDARSTVGSTGGNVSISAGKDAAIIGSDVMAGSAGGATGNIDVRAQNIRIEAGQDHAWSSSSQEAHSSGISVGLVGTPLDTLRNQREAQRDPSKVNRVRNSLNEVGAGYAATGDRVQRPRQPQPDVERIADAQRQPADRIGRHPSARHGQRRHRCQRTRHQRRHHHHRQHPERRRHGGAGCAAQCRASGVHRHLPGVEFGQQLRLALQHGRPLLGRSWPQCRWRAEQQRGGACTLWLRSQCGQRRRQQQPPERVGRDRQERAGAGAHGRHHRRGQWHFGAVGCGPAGQAGQGRHRGGQRHLQSPRGPFQPHDRRSGRQRLLRHGGRAQRQQHAGYRQEPAEHDPQPGKQRGRQRHHRRARRRNGARCRCVGRWGPEGDRPQRAARRGAGRRAQPADGIVEPVWGDAGDVGLCGEHRAVGRAGRAGCRAAQGSARRGAVSGAGGVDGLQRCGESRSELPERICHPGAGSGAAASAVVRHRQGHAQHRRRVVVERVERQRHGQPGQHAARWAEREHHGDGQGRVGQGGGRRHRGARLQHLGAQRLARCGTRYHPGKPSGQHAPGQQERRLECEHRRGRGPGRQPDRFHAGAGRGLQPGACGRGCGHARELVGERRRHADAQRWSGCEPAWCASVGQHGERHGGPQPERGEPTGHGQLRQPFGERRRAGESVLSAVLLRVDLQRQRERRGGQDRQHVCVGGASERYRGGHGRLQHQREGQHGSGGRGDLVGSGAEQERAAHGHADHAGRGEPRGVLERAEQRQRELHQRQSAQLGGGADADATGGEQPGEQCGRQRAGADRGECIGHDALGHLGGHGRHHRQRGAGGEDRQGRRSNGRELEPGHGAR
ncbi:cell surface protein [Ralstonia solanacearum]|nr:cell surface protein [Ralstonia solanacearum]